MNRTSRTAHSRQRQCISALQLIGQRLETEVSTPEAVNRVRRMLFGVLPGENGSNAERIRQMRAAYFADVDALEKSGTLKLLK